MYHFHSWVPIWANRRRMSCRLSRIARSVDNGKKLIWVFMSVCRVPWNTRDFSVSYPAVTVKCEDAGTCQYGLRYMSIWTPIHVNINAGTCQEERRYMSTWTPAMSTWTPVHVNMDAGTCQYELRYVSVWTPVRVNMNARTCQYERRYVSLWTPVHVNMNAGTCQYERWYMSIWMSVYVNMNAGTCQYERRYMSIWTPVHVNMNSSKRLNCFAGVWANQRSAQHILLHTGYHGCTAMRRPHCTTYWHFLHYILMSIPPYLNI